MNPILAIVVDGVPVSTDEFAVPAMSLSSARAGMTRQEFTVSLDRTVLSAHLEPVYQALAAELREDDAVVGHATDPLGEAGYPPLAVVLDQPALLDDLLAGFVGRDLLEEFTRDGAGPRRYWLDTLTAARADGVVVVLEGVCYSHPTGAGYRGSWNHRTGRLR